MPTYAYACTACEHRFEIVQSFVDDSLTECPECTGRLRKLFNAVGVVFKGSGFYRTDSRNDARKASGGGPRSGSGKDSRGSGSANGSTPSSAGSSSTESSSGSTSSDSSSSAGSTKTTSSSEGSNKGSNRGSDAGSKTASRAASKSGGPAA